MPRRTTTRTRNRTRARSAAPVRRSRRNKKARVDPEVIQEALEGTEEVQIRGDDAAFTPQPEDQKDVDDEMDDELIQDGAYAEEAKNELKDLTKVSVENENPELDDGNLVTVGGDRRAEAELDVSAHQETPPRESSANNRPDMGKLTIVEVFGEDSDDETERKERPGDGAESQKDLSKKLEPSMSSRGNTGQEVKGDPELFKCGPATTGRSKCRKCLKNIGKGELRIGLQAFIAGRVSNTWQHPTCFLENIEISRDKSGRSHCKASGKAFEKGEPRISFHSHTAVAHLKFDALPDTLAPVVKEIESRQPSQISGKDKIRLDPSQWTGFDTLTDSEKISLRAHIPVARSC